MNGIKRWVAGAVVLMWSASAEATTVVGLDLPELSARASTVVRGTVKSRESRWTQEGRRIITEVEVEVAETLKGSAPQRVSVIQPGGQVGDIGQRVDGVARFDVGEEVVLFLDRRGTRAFELTGMAQGKYRVERSSDLKSAFAVPEPLGQTRVVDRHTGQEAEPRRVTLPLEQLRSDVRTAVQEAPKLPSRPRLKRGGP